MAHNHRMEEVGEPHLNKVNRMRAVNFSDIDGYAEYTAPAKPYVVPANRADIKHSVDEEGTQRERHTLSINGINHWTGHADDVESVKSALTPYSEALKSGVPLKDAERQTFNGTIHYPNKTKGLDIQ